MTRQPARHAERPREARYAAPAPETARTPENASPCLSVPLAMTCGTALDLARTIYGGDASIPRGARHLIAGALDRHYRRLCPCFGGLPGAGLEIDPGSPAAKPNPNPEGTP